jgi:hypothetical protein
VRAFSSGRHRAAAQQQRAECQQLPLQKILLTEKQIEERCRRRACSFATIKLDDQRQFLLLKQARLHLFPRGRAAKA